MQTEQKGAGAGSPPEDAVTGEHTPSDLREGVRTGVLAALTGDFELRGGHTARLLFAAGAMGIAGAVGVTLLVSRHPFDHHPPWHVVVFSAVWAGLLVVGLSIVLLDVRTPTLPLARSAAAGVFGLGLAGICGALCPDQHFLAWWSSTAVGGELTASGGAVVAALCFGLMTSLGFGVASALLVLGDPRGRPNRPLLPAAALLLFLAPGVALQSFDTSWGVFGAWLLGTACGSYAGIAAGIRLRRHLHRSWQAH